ncbi:DUF29 domain-containing protein [Pannus brasiliensis CCIBt3594]|uniref:DUF29 domain-containing protein n=1 Tax=Pannus brasiliensis CCIBt3594 TaxID=1427578 RepID=A0AAW9QF30_9CHRO
MDAETLYDRDFYLWIGTTINQLQVKQFQSVDLPNLIEELESMGGQEKRSMRNLLTRLLENLLKLGYWTAERERNENHWKGEILTFRRDIADEIEDSPGLKPYILEIFPDGYERSREEVSVRDRLPIETFPVTPIGSLEQVLDTKWFPAIESEEER